MGNRACIAYWNVVKHALHIFVRGNHHIAGFLVGRAPCKGDFPSHAFQRVTIEWSRRDGSIRIRHGLSPNAFVRSNTGTYARLDVQTPRKPVACRSNAASAEREVQESYCTPGTAHYNFGVMSFSKRLAHVSSCVAI